MGITRNEELDEHLEQLWYMKEQQIITVDFMKKALKQAFDPKIVDALSAAGLVVLGPEASAIRLTDTGEARARQLIRAHRLAERLITDVLGGGDLEQIACEFEHTVSLELVNGICTLLGHPKECPHGMPIPEGACCRLAQKAEFSFIIPLTDLKPGESARVAYINCRDDRQIHTLEGLCIRPGAMVKLHQDYPTHVIECEGSSIALDKAVVANISVWRNLQESSVPMPAVAVPDKDTRGVFRKFFNYIIRKK
ncbi:MAG: metal-dependent transcriptional regulator [Candidatus Omnitrophota bacterium]